MKYRITKLVDKYFTLSFTCVLVVTAVLGTLIEYVITSNIRQSLFIGQLLMNIIGLIYATYTIMIRRS